MTAPAAQAGAGRVGYLFTTFPVASETFVRREVQAMRALGVDVRAWSLWGGATMVDGLRVERLRLRSIVRLLWRLPWAVVRHPAPFAELLHAMLATPPRSLLNLGENLWGAAAAALIEPQVRAAGCTRLHAVWSSMPATTAWLLHRLLGLPYSTGAHAYDVFEHGGDWLLPLKLRDAFLVHTTNDAARRRLLELGCAPGKLVLVRRGLVNPPPLKPLRPRRTPLRLLAVGRLVEKKGYRTLLALCGYLRDKGFAFELRVVGGGPLQNELEAQVARLGLAHHVRLLGELEEVVVRVHLEWGDAFVFTGQVARNGDRDGFPNAIAEAMATGLPVVSTPVGGIPEVLGEAGRGVLLPLDGRADFPAWLAALAELRDHNTRCEALRHAARTWVETHFDAHTNAHALLEAVAERGNAEG